MHNELPLGLLPRTCIRQPAARTSLLSVAVRVCAYGKPCISAIYRTIATAGPEGSGELRPRRVRRPPDVPLVQPRTRCPLVQAAVELVLGRHMRLVPPLRRPFRVPECIPLVSPRHAHPQAPRGECRCRSRCRGRCCRLLHRPRSRSHDPRSATRRTKVILRASSTIIDGRPSGRSSCGDGGDRR
jgi:hypothetical protein